MDSFLLGKEKKAEESARLEREAKEEKWGVKRRRRGGGRERKGEELKEAEEEDGQGRWSRGKALTLVKKNRTPVKTVMISPASLR